MTHAIQTMCSIRFRAENKEDCIFAFTYEAGKLDICQELLSYDNPSPAQE